MFTMLSLLNLETLLCQSGIAHTYRFVGNEPYIDRVRNRLAAMFLESGCTDMLFVDADIEFDALDVIGLMAADRPVIGASYPRKGLDWAAVKRAVLNDPKIDPELLGSCASLWTHVDVLDTQIEPLVPVRVAGIATGFMLVQAETFFKLAPLVERYRATDNDAPIKAEWISNFFPAGKRGEYWIGEDYQFCCNWRELAGGEIYVCPWMTLKHHGVHAYAGNLHVALQLKSELELSQCN